MEIGLTAKVKPDVDDREVDRQASSLRGRMQEAVDGLKAHVDFDDMEDKLGQMEEHTDHISSSSSEFMENMEETVSHLEEFDMSTLEQLSDGDFAMDVMFGGGEAPGEGPGDDGDEGGQGGGGVVGMLPQGAGIADSLDSVGNMISQNSGKMGSVVSRLGSISGILSGLGSMFMKGGGAIAIAGIGLMFLGTIASKVAEASPLLGQISSMLGMAINLFFRPFGNIIGKLLLPLISGILGLAANFNRVFGSEGILKALGWLAKELTIGLIDAFWAIMEWVVVSLPMFIVNNLPKILAGLILVAFAIALAPIWKPLLAIVAGLMLLASLFKPTREVVDFVASILESLYTGLTSILSALPRILLGLLTGGFLVALTASGIAPTIGAVAGILIGIASVLRDMDKIVAGTKSFIADLKKATAKGFEMLGGILKWLLGGVHDVVGWVSSILTLFVVYAIEFFSWLWGGLKWFFGVFEAVVEWFKDPYIPDILGEMGGMVLEAGGELYDSIVQWINQGGRYVLDKLEQAGDLAEEGMEYVEDVLEDGADLLEKTLDSVGQRLSDGAAWIRSSAGDLRDRIYDGATWVRNQGRRLRKWISKTHSWVKTQGSRLRDRLRSVHEWVIARGRQIRDNLVSLRDWIFNKGSQVRDNLVALKDWIFAQGGKLKDAIIQIKDWVSSAGNSLKSAIDSVASSINNILSSISLSGDGGSAEGRVVKSPSISSLAEKEPEVVIPFSKLDAFVNRMMQGKSPAQAIPNPETGSLPKLASGGVVTDSTIAMIGEGKESEAVLPLSKLESMMSSPDSMDMSSVSGSGGSGGSMKPIKVDVSSASSEEDIATQIRDAIGTKLDQINANVQALAKEIKKMDTDQPIQITADGKVLAEVNSLNKEKYTNSRRVNK